jgi:hypothetical protein
LPPAAPGLREPFTDEYTGATFTLNTKNLSWADAEAQCNELGGHVACYGGIAEQVAVEMFYASTKAGTAGWQEQWTLTSLKGMGAICHCMRPSRAGTLAGAFMSVTQRYATRTLQGLFLPSFHKAYWLGLNGTLSDPALDVNGTTNRSWAWVDGVTPPPNIGNNYRHWGNWTVKRVVVSVEPNNFYTNESCAVANASLAYQNAYGWGDEACELNMTSICKTQRGCLCAVPAAGFVGASVLCPRGCAGSGARVTILPTNASACPQPPAPTCTSPR